MAGEIDRLRALCQQWGGDLIEVSDDEFLTLSCRDDFYDAPFGSAEFGTLWRQKRIYYTSKTAWPDLVHEMGHVFASRRNPNACNEYDFLGWEYAVARFIGALTSDWRAGMADYQLMDDETGRGDDIGSLSRRDFRRLMLDRLTVARRKGLLDGMTPKVIR